MENNTFIMAQQIAGRERKAVAGKIAEVVGEDVKYLGPPTFAYGAGDWKINKAGIVSSPETGINAEGKLKAVLDRLKAEDLKAEGDLVITVPASGHTGITLRNLINILSSKENLIKKAFDRQDDIIPRSLVEAFNSASISTIEDFMMEYNTGIEDGKYTADCDLCFNNLPGNISFSFFNATFDIDEITAYVMFCIRLNEQAKTQRYASTKQKEVENEKFAFRCFLLRLGFIGDEYKTERKVLLSRLEGNGSWKKVASDTQ